MADPAKQREIYRQRLINNYKNHAQSLWSGDVGANWDSTYARPREEWGKVDPLWGNRYGGGTGIEVGSGDIHSGYDRDGAGSGNSGGHGVRGAYGSKIMTDGINMYEQMKDDELQAIIDAGEIAKHAQDAAAAQIEALKAHLIATRDRVNMAGTTNNKMDPTTNSITGNLMDRSNEEVKKDPPPGAPKRDVAKPKLSKAGIAYDTIEYKEQCFLLSQLWKIVSHKHDIVEAYGNEQLDEKLFPKGEYKPLPYVDEGVGVVAKEGQKGLGDKIAAKNACLMVDADTPHGFINRLTQYGSQQTFLSLPTSDISQLQPQIRLFKVRDNFSDAGANEETQQEILFETTTTVNDISSMLTTKGKRGYGAGIKDFTVNYEASNPFGIKKSISATLTIFANTFDELMLDRGGYSYIDLALKTGGLDDMSKFRLEHGGSLNPKENTKLYNLSKLNFRLKAVVGWQVPPGKGLSTPDVQKMLYNSFVTINLTPVIHTFDFDDAGRVTFKIEYLAYIEDFFDENSYSIFSDLDITRKQHERDREYRLIEEMCDGKSLAELKKKLGKEVSQDLAEARATMWRKLAKSGKLRMINLKHSTLRKYQELGPYFDLPKAEQEAWNIQNVSAEIKHNQALIKELKKYSKTRDVAVGHKDTTNANNDRQVSLIYFYVSDLMDIVLSGIDHSLDDAVEYFSILNSLNNIEIDDMTGKYTPGYEAGLATMSEEEREEYLTMVENTKNTSQEALDLWRAQRLRENFRRYRLLLGPIEIVNPEQPDQSQTINLGDLPISYKYFMEWLTARTLKKDRPFYPIASFLNDFFNGLINGFINDDKCFSLGKAQARQSTNLNQTMLTAYKNVPEAPDPISEMLHEYRTTKREYVGYDLSRLHLTNHDGTNAWLGAMLPIQEWPILNISGPKNSLVTSRNIPYEINYAVYYAGRVAPKEKMKGRIEEDNRLGIMHYVAGRDRGLIKNIQFQKTETPGLRELRLEQSGYDGLSQLKEVYNVKIDTYANVSAFPGTYVFVDPRGLVPNMSWSSGKYSNMDPANLSTYGIGGYYMIIRSSHSFGEGKANTSIDCVWVAELAKEKGDDSNPFEAKPLEDDERWTKCSIDNSKNMGFSGTPPTDDEDTVSTPPP